MYYTYWLFLVHGFTAFLIDYLLIGTFSFSESSFSYMVLNLFKIIFFVTRWKVSIINKGIRIDLKSKVNVYPVSKYPLITDSSVMSARLVSVLPGYRFWALTLRGQPCESLPGARASARVQSATFSTYKMEIIVNGIKNVYFIPRSLRSKLFYGMINLNNFLFSIPTKSVRIRTDIALLEYKIEVSKSSEK
jgi:hypothetical protein